MAVEAMSLAEQAQDAIGVSSCSMRTRELFDRLDRAIAIKQEANAAYNGQRFDEALQLYHKALNCFRGEPDTLSNRCACLLRKGDYEGAVQDAKAVLRREPHRIKCVWRGAQALVALGQPSGAIEMLMPSKGR